MRALGFAVLAALMTAEAQAATCESLLTLSLPHTNEYGHDHDPAERGEA